MKRSIPMKLDRKAANIRDWWWRFQRTTRLGCSPSLCVFEFRKYFLVPEAIEECTLVLTSTPDPDFYQCKFDDRSEMFLLLNENTGKWEEVCATGGVDSFFRQKCKAWYEPNGMGSTFYLGVEHETA